MKEIDNTKLIYIRLNLHDGFKEKTEECLLAYGFKKNQLTYEDAEKYGEKGHYVAAVRLKDVPPRIEIGVIIGVPTIYEKDGKPDAGIMLRPFDTIELKP